MPSSTTRQSPHTTPALPRHFMDNTMPTWLKPILITLAIVAGYNLMKSKTPLGAYLP